VCGQRPAIYSGPLATHRNGPVSSNVSHFNKEKIKMDKKFFIKLLISGAVLWLLSIPIMYLFFPRPVTAHDFGDMFGAINALFSGLALAGVIYAVLMQTEDIKNNQTQIEKTSFSNSLVFKL
jgi:hypothetical protein